MPPVRVALIEDEQDYANALRSVLSYSSGFTPAGHFIAGSDALLGLKMMAVDVVVVDLHLPDMDGIDCVRRVKEVRPEVRVLILSKFGAPDTIVAAIRAGADGYVLKTDGFQEFLAAVEAVHEGRGVMSPAIASKVIELLRESTPVIGKSQEETQEELSERELTILRLVEKGKLTKEVADELSIQPKTVSNHLTSIYRKLRVTGGGRRKLKQGEGSPRITNRHEWLDQSRDLQ